MGHRRCTRQTFFFTGGEISSQGRIMKKSAVSQLIRIFFLISLNSLVNGDTYLAMILKSGEDHIPCAGALVTRKHVVTAASCICYGGEKKENIEVLTFRTSTMEQNHRHKVTNIFCQHVNETAAKAADFGEKAAIIELADSISTPIVMEDRYPPETETILYTMVHFYANDTEDIRTIPATVRNEKYCTKHGSVIHPDKKVCGSTASHKYTNPMLGSPVISENDKLIGVIYEVQEDITNPNEMVFAFNDFTDSKAYPRVAIDPEFLKFVDDNYEPLHIRPAAEVTYLPDIQLRNLQRLPSHEPYLVYLRQVGTESLSLGVLITAHHVLGLASFACPQGQPAKIEVMSLRTYTYMDSDSIKSRHVYCGDSENEDTKKVALILLSEITYDPIEMSKNFPPVEDPIYYTTPRKNANHVMKDVKYKAEVSKSCGSLTNVPGRTTCGKSRRRLYEPMEGAPILSLENKLIGIMISHVIETDQVYFSYIDVPNIRSFINKHVDEAYFDRFKPEAILSLTGRGIDTASNDMAVLEQTKNLYDNPADEPYLVQFKDINNHLTYCAGVIISDVHVLTSARCICNKQFADIQVTSGEGFHVKRTVKKVDCEPPLGPYSSRDNLHKSAIVELTQSVKTPARLADTFPEEGNAVFYTIYHENTTKIIRLLAYMEDKTYCEGLVLYPKRTVCGKMKVLDPAKEPIYGSPVLSLDNRVLGVVFDVQPGPNKNKIFSFTDIANIPDFLHSKVPKDKLKVISPETKTLSDVEFSAHVGFPLEQVNNLYDSPYDLPYLVFMRVKGQRQKLCNGVLITRGNVLTLASCICSYKPEQLEVVANDNYQYGDTYTYRVESIDCEPSKTGYGTSLTNRNKSALVTLATNTFTPIRLVEEPYPPENVIFYTIYNPNKKNITKLLAFVEDELYCKQSELAFNSDKQTCGKVETIDKTKQPEKGAPVISIRNELLGLIFDTAVGREYRTIFSYTNITLLRPFLDSKVDRRLFRVPDIHTHPTYETAFSADSWLVLEQTKNIYDNPNDLPYLMRLREKGTNTIFCSGVLITRQHVLTSYGCVCHPRVKENVEVLSSDNFIYHSSLTMDVKSIHCEQSNDQLLQKSAVLELYTKTFTPVQIADKFPEVQIDDHVYYTIFDHFKSNQIIRILAMLENSEYCGRSLLSLYPSKRVCGKIIGNEGTKEPVLGTPVLSRENKLLGLAYEVKNGSSGKRVFSFTDITKIRPWLDSVIDKSMYKVIKPETTTVSGKPFSADVPLHIQKVKHDHPFLVLLYPLTASKPYCAGALITHNHILTLASCVCNAANRYFLVFTSSSYMFKNHWIDSHTINCNSHLYYDAEIPERLAIVELKGTWETPVEMSFKAPGTEDISYVMPYTPENAPDKIFVKRLPASNSDVKKCRDKGLLVTTTANTCMETSFSAGMGLLRGMPVIEKNKLIGLMYGVPDTMTKSSVFSYVDLAKAQTYIYGEIDKAHFDALLDEEDATTYDSFTSKNLNVFRKHAKLEDPASYNIVQFSYLALILGHGVIHEHCHGTFISDRHVATSASCICRDNEDIKGKYKVQTYESYFQKNYKHKGGLEGAELQTKVCPTETDQPREESDVLKKIAVITLKESVANIQVARRSLYFPGEGTKVYYLTPLRTEETTLYAVRVMNAIVVNWRECVDNGIRMVVGTQSCSVTSNKKLLPTIGGPMLTEDNEVFGVVYQVQPGKNGSHFYIAYTDVTRSLGFLNRAFKD